MLETILLIAQTQLGPDENQLRRLNNWFLDKKFKSTDFSILNILKTDFEKQKIADVLLKCQSLSASFSETLNIIELATELVMLSPEAPLLDHSDQLTSWKSAMQKLRFPQSTATDEFLKNKLENLPWPFGAKVKFERRGDRAGVELKLFITSQADLTKSMAALERVKEQL